MSTEAAEAVQEEVKEQEAFTYELPEEEVSAVKATVLATHKGKAEDELTEEITAATTARIEELKEEYAPIFAKAAELKALPENAEKTEDELVALAQEAVAAADPKGTDTYDINSDPEFLGRQEKGAAANTPSASEVELPAEIKEKVAKYEKIETDPVMVAYLQAKESNADFDLVEMIAQSGLAYDPAKASYTEVKRWELKEAQKEDANITDEQIEDELADFADKTPIRQREEVKATRDHLIAQYKEAKSKFAVQVAQKTDTSRESFVQSVKEAESELKTYEGQKYRGADVSKAQTDKVLGLIRSGVIPFKKADGTPDMSKSVEALMSLELLPAMRQAAYERGKRDAEIKFSTTKGKPLPIRARSAATPARSTNSRDAFNKEKERMLKQMDLA